MGDKIVKSKNLCCQPVVFPSLSLLKQNLAKKEGMEQTCIVHSMLQVLGTRFRAGFVYNMGDEEASKDAAAAAALAVLDAGRSSSDSRGPGGGVGLRTAT